MSNALLTENTSVTALPVQRSCRRHWMINRRSSVQCVKNWWRESSGTMVCASSSVQNVTSTQHAPFVMATRTCTSLQTMFYLPVSQKAFVLLPRLRSKFGQKGEGTSESGKAIHEYSSMEVSDRQRRDGAVSVMQSRRSYMFCRTCKHVRSYSPNALTLYTVISVVICATVRLVHLPNWVKSSLERAKSSVPCVKERRS